MKQREKTAALDIIELSVQKQEADEGESTARSFK